MTNQTIDGVLVSSSDLKEIYDHMVGVWQMIDKDHGECGVTLEQLMDRGGHPVIAKVRALLAKSRTTYVIGTSHKCDKRVPYGRGVTIPCGTSVDGVVRYHDSCRVTREVEDVVVAAPAAEPVAVFEIDTTGYRCRVTLDPSKGLPPNGTNLYAEPQKHGEPVRPAPVAGDLSVEETEFLKTVAASPGCKLSGYDDEGSPLWRRLEDLGLIVATGGYKWKTTFDVFELGIAAALGQRLPPVAVVMRCSFCDVVNDHGSPWSGHNESVDGNLVYRVIGCKDHKHLVDAFLDAVTRLNPSL